MNLRLFRVCLVATLGPLFDCAAAQSGGGNKEALSPDSKFLSGFRILFVEDDDFYRQDFGDLLLRFGALHVERATDGFDGLKKLETLTFDFIITDFRMPRMNGVEFAATVRERGINVPIIMNSSDDIRDFKPEDLEHFVFKLSKWWSIDSIKATLLEILGDIGLIASSSKNGTNENHQSGGSCEDTLGGDSV